MTHLLRFNRLALVPVIAIILPACSGVEQQRLEYRQSQSIAPLEIPTGLQSPQSKEMLPLQPVNSEAVGVDVKPPQSLPQELQPMPKSSEKSAKETDLTDEN